MGVELDDSGDRIGAKIRRATMEKVPYILVIGEQEMSEKTVNVRTREGKQLGTKNRLTFTLRDGKFADLVDGPDDLAAWDDFWG